MILSDDGYREVRLSAVEPGDIAVYYDMDHVSHTGMIIEVVEGDPPGPNLRAVRVLSKWASAGEYVHRAQDGPYAEGRVTYWTDRP